MRQYMMRGLWLAVAGTWGATAYLGCAASQNEGKGGDDTSNFTISTGGGGGTTTGSAGGAPVGGAGGEGGLAITTTTTGTGGGTSTGGGGQGGGPQGCAKFSVQAELAPAAMLVVLDMTASMTTSQKWSTSQLAVVNAIDKDVFDSMSLGLVTFPVSFTPPPKCVCDYIDQNYGPGFCSLVLPQGVSCGVSGLPQVALAPAGKSKSNAPSGVRHDIYQYLVSHQPISSDDDGSPVYEALSNGYAALKALQGVDKRMLVLITDGGFSCTSLSSPQRQAFTDLYGCQDWEHPDNVNKVIGDSRTDPNTPINTFVVGVPGSNTNGGKSGKYDNAPYPMLLALSTYAVSGSPDTVDAACDKNAVFTKNGQAPAKPCHIDLSSGQFNPDVLADAIAKLRGKALGCVYPLPKPPPGETIDLDKVNVVVTLDGNKSTIPKRSDPKDTCDQAPCWDYILPQNHIEILGKGCLDLGKAASAKVEISVGCTTILK